MEQGHLIIIKKKNNNNNIGNINQKQNLHRLTLHRAHALDSSSFRVEIVCNTISNCVFSVWSFFCLFLWLVFPFQIYTEEAEKYFFGVEIGNGTVLPSN